MADEASNKTQDQEEPKRVGGRLGNRFTDQASRWRTPGAQTNNVLLPQEVTYPNDTPHHV